MAYTVKAVADLAGVSVRTLHHYDAIGLLRPASVSPAGYRLYTDADLERLQQILFFRELGFGLQEIKAIMESPGFDRKEALATHRRLLVEQQKRLARLISAIDRTIDAIERGVPVSKDDLFAGFDETQLQQYREEALARWGKTAEESFKRTSTYSTEDWAAIQAESDAINRGLVSLMDRDPADPEVQALVDRWFRLINDRFYTCSLEIFRGLGDGYVNDSRFTAFYDKYKPGLAAFLRAAMHVYCDQREGQK
jgi:DNA-binding transcriptional MerR regulator